MNDNYIIEEGNFITILYAQLKESIFPFSVKKNKNIHLLSLLKEIKRNTKYNCYFN